jgi:hypothetical protein
MTTKHPAPESPITAEIVMKERIEGNILFLRGQKVMLDRDLAALYGVPTKALKQAVKRNADRFPSDFMFEMNEEEMADMRSQTVTSKRGGTRYAPMAFTEQGVAMLSMFYGILIRMFFHDIEKHHAPHIHAEYQGMWPYIRSRMARYCRAVCHPKSTSSWLPGLKFTMRI